jgi:hypothetical protein
MAEVARHWSARPAKLTRRLHVGPSVEVIQHQRAAVIVGQAVEFLIEELSQLVSSPLGWCRSATTKASRPRSTRTISRSARPIRRTAERTRSPRPRRSTGRKRWSVNCVRVSKNRLPKVEASRRRLPMSFSTASSRSTAPSVGGASPAGEPALPRVSQTQPALPRRWLPRPAQGLRHDERRQADS